MGKPLKKIEAFTLVEVLVTLVIVSVSLLAILKGNFFNLRSSKEASDLTTAVIAAESLLKEAIGEGYPESGILEGEFEDGLFGGMKWKKTIETMDIPFTQDLKLVTVEVTWGRGRIYKLRTIVSRY